MSSGDESLVRDRKQRKHRRSRESTDRKKRKRAKLLSSDYARSSTDSPWKKEKKKKKKKKRKSSSSHQETERRRSYVGEEKDVERTQGVPTIHPDRAALVQTHKKNYEPTYNKLSVQEHSPTKLRIRDHKPYVPEVDRALGDMRPLSPSPPKPRDDIPLSIQNAFNQLEPKKPPPKNNFQIDEFGRQAGGEEEPVEKEQPCFEPSGALDEPDKVIKRGVEIEYREPRNAMMPKEKWVWFVYKDEEQVKEIWLHRKSYHLVGRCRKSCDVKLMHFTISKHHCVLQYRQRCLKGVLGVYPYLMDLGSRHGTFLNKQKLIPKKYYQLLSKDVIVFGKSSRKYIMMARGLINYHDIEIEKSDKSGDDSSSSEDIGDDGLDW